jgi:hypothetical protein
VRCRAETAIEMNTDTPIEAEAADRDPATVATALRRAARLTALAGAVHAVLFLLSFWLVTRIPGANASDAELVAFYTGAEVRRPALVGLYLMPFAGIAFLWFADALRIWSRALTRRENQLLSSMQLVAGILYVGLFFATAAAYTVTAASVEFASGQVDPMLARLFPEFGRTIFYFFALRMAAVFAFTTSNILRAAGILPQWLGWVGIAAGVVLLLTPTFSDWLALVFPAWLLVLSAAVLMAAGQIPVDAVGSSAAAPASRHTRGETWQGGMKGEGSGEFDR